MMFELLIQRKEIVAIALDDIRKEEQSPLGPYDGVDDVVPLGSHGCVFRGLVPLVLVSQKLSITRTSPSHAFGC
ncbi:hypothetical protein CVM73_18860 [Bradyrhizobium forestalis]|uniref:Uncharacterized protein n=1 Tax=Bradyrhizobium forestalis TaxID=1419263 RepID=A0A2M8R7H6_9BRAD|nr:hypothetical protein [Bradyrhizobium forestalis]PJG53783.1 hypothetical protein CVM73_18860 [Bradyrhizobium forestalis]